MNVGSLGGHWHLEGSIKPAETGLPVLRLRNIPQGSGELVLVRKIDVLSPHLSVANTTQFLIPKLTVTTPSGEQINFQKVRIKSKTDTHELERISFTFQKIDITDKVGKKSTFDDWQVPG